MFREIDINDKIEQRKIKSQFKKNPPWVFVGSAISLFTPTSIPTGKKISEFVTKWILDSNIKYIRSKSQKDEIEELFKTVIFEQVFERSTDIEKAKEVINDSLKNVKANRFHEILVTALINGKIAGIVTTNYDLGFENAKDFDRNIIKIIVDEQDAVKYLVGDKIIFKIHGTCDDNRGGSIHCTLRDESKLPIWKNVFLQRIWNNNIILFTGYSGFDFEICQEICNYSNIKGIYWNDIKGYCDLSNNAKKVIMELGGSVLIGDISEALSLINGYKVGNLPVLQNELSIRLNYLKYSLERNFNNEDLFLWLIFILTSCGYASASNDLSSSMMNKVKRNKLFYNKLSEQNASAKYKMGAYRKSSLGFIRAAYGNKENQFLMISQLIDAIESLKAGFMLIRATLLFCYCQYKIDKISVNNINNNDIEFLKIRLSNRKNELGSRLGNINANIITRLLLRFIKYQKVEDIQEKSAQKGDWILNYNDKVSHAHGLVSSQEYEDISIKMKGIGCMFEYFYNYRRFIEKKYAENGVSTLTSDILKEIGNVLSKEDTYEIYPEIWKMKRFLCKIGLLKPIDQWRKEFRNCEYSIYGKILINKDIVKI